MNLIEQLQSKIEQARTLYKEFRLYDLGSFALNRFTPKMVLNRSQMYVMV